MSINIFLNEEFISLESIKIFLCCVMLQGMWILASSLLWVCSLWIREQLWTLHLFHYFSRLFILKSEGQENKRVLNGSMEIWKCSAVRNGVMGVLLWISMYRTVRKDHTLLNPYLQLSSCYFALLSLLECSQ